MTNPKIPLARSLAVYIRSLRTGDQYVLLILGILVLVTSLMSAYALEKHFLVSVPAYGGVLNEGVLGAPRFINPLLAISDTDHDLTALTYAGLMGRNASGAVVPILASSYNVSPDGLTYTFTIRMNAKFSDGTPVTAEDVVYTVQKAQDPLLKSPVRSSWTNIRAEVIDAQTVRFTLPKPYATFIQNTTLGILPAHIWRTISDEEFPFSTYTTAPVGSGPFEVSKVTRDASGTVTSYRMSAFKNYVLGKPYIGTIQFNVFADAASLSSALHNGIVQSGYGVTSAKPVVIPFAQVFSVFFNPTIEPFYSDVSVRKALSQAINRYALIQQVLGGYATATYGPLPGSVAASSAGSTVNDARQTLSSGGWNFSTTTNTWNKGSEQLVITLKTGNVPELKAVASEIQHDWQAIGVPVTIDFVSPSDIVQSVIRPRAFGALLFGEVTGPNPDLYAFWHSNQRNDPGLNIASFSDKAVDALLEKARTQTDPIEHFATTNAASALVASEYSAAFIYTPDFLYTVPSNLQGASFKGPITRPADRFSDVQNWYLQSELVWPLFATRR
jgi:peptide/nickel transport system substrate-binding protein